MEKLKNLMAEKPALKKANRERKEEKISPVQNM
jgi:hypothetical protein